MMYVLAQETYETVTIDGADQSPIINVGATGGDSIAYQLLVSDGSTPTDATIQLFGSIDGVNFVAIGSTVAITNDGSYGISYSRPELNYYQIQYAIDSGSYSAQLMVLVKGDKAG